MSRYKACSNECYRHFDLPNAISCFIQHTRVIQWPLWAFNFVTSSFFHFIFRLNIFFFFYVTFVYLPINTFINAHCMNCALIVLPYYCCFCPDHMNTFKNIAFCLLSAVTLSTNLLYFILSAQRLYSIYTYMPFSNLLPTSHSYLLLWKTHFWFLMQWSKKMFR